MHLERYTIAELFCFFAVDITSVRIVSNSVVLLIRLSNEDKMGCHKQNMQLWLSNSVMQQLFITNNFTKNYFQSHLKVLNSKKNAITCLLPYREKLLLLPIVHVYCRLDYIRVQAQTDYKEQKTITCLLDQSINIEHNYKQKDNTHSLHCHNCLYCSVVSV